MSFIISVANQVLFGSLNQGNEMGGACGRQGGKKKFIKGFGGESRRKKELGKPRRGWKVNINIYLKEKGRDDEP